MFIVAVLLMLTIATTVRSDGVWHDRPARAANDSMPMSQRILLMEGLAVRDSSLAKRVTYGLVRCTAVCSQVPSASDVYQLGVNFKGQGATQYAATTTPVQQGGYGKAAAWLVVNAELHGSLTGTQIGEALQLIAVACVTPANLAQGAITIMLNNDVDVTIYAVYNVNGCD
jgi:hypothetical protein